MTGSVNGSDGGKDPTGVVKLKVGKTGGGRRPSPVLEKISDRS